MFNVHITPVSSNRKTGRIPVSTTDAATCPPSCPLQGGGCYAKSGPLAMHWKKVSTGERVVPFGEFIRFIGNLPQGQLWRHNQAGDLAGKGNTIDGRLLGKLVNANKGKRGFTYTHKPLTSENASLIEYANREGFTVNLSANNLRHADKLADHGIAPVCTIVPSEKTRRTPAGRKVKICPAQTSDNVTCESCGLCQKVNRDFVIGFVTHGTGKRKAQAIAERGTK